MFTNRYILIFLYIYLASLYIRYLFLCKNTSLDQLKKKTDSLVLLFTIGLLIALVIGIVKGTFPTAYGWIDIIRILSFISIFISPIVYSKSRIFRSKKIENIFYKFALIFVLLTSFSLFYSGMSESLFIGNIFRASTVNLTLISLLVFSGLEYYYVKNKSIGLIIAIIGWITCVASLAKWNIVVDIFGPILIYKVWSSKNKGKGYGRAIGYLGAAAVFIVLAPLIPKFVNLFANLNEFETARDYLNSRILRSQQYQSMVESGVFITFGEYGIKDGGRLAMWIDLVGRTLKSPIWGLGLGARTNYNMGGLALEDHNIIVFFIVRYGFLLFYLVIHFVKRSLISFFRIVEDFSFPIKNHIFKVMIINFFFQAIVGNVWGQIPIALVLGLIIWLFIPAGFKTRQT